MGLGNSAYALGNYSHATSAFRDATAAHPDSAAAHNNLANMLMILGDAKAAKLAAEKALALAGADQAMRVQIVKTIEEINSYTAKNPH
jgi:Flp pilus assembly protein TadD